VIVNVESEATAYESDVREALNAGAQIYLIKPIDPDELHRAIAKLTLASSAKAVEAQQAEIAAIREELAIRRMENA
jgi:DNA-binding response OmpR family regulator